MGGRCFAKSVLGYIRKHVDTLEEEEATKWLAELDALCTKSS
jgi:hypothetical protein